MDLNSTRLDSRMTEVSHNECRCSVNDDNVRSVSLDFGQIPVDFTVTKCLKIMNDTCNEESYEIHRDPTTNPLDVVFHFNKYSWSLAPGNSSVFQIRFNPLIANERSVDYFSIVNNARTIMKLTTRGRSIGPKVSTSKDEFLMSCCLDEIVKKRIKIVNESDVSANFWFDVDVKQSTFKPEPTEGCINGRSHVYIVIAFEPKSHGYHVSQLPCVIHHQAPIIIRLYGYCDKQEKGKKPFVPPTLVYPTLEKNRFEVYMSDCNKMRKVEVTDPCQRDPISLSINYIDFGRSDVTLTAKANLPPRPTCFTNHALMDMLVKWHEDVDGVFSLTPKSVRVKAGETCLFEVRFHPNEEDTFYEREFQAIIFYVEDHSSVPIFSFSMIASLRVMGHTFPADSSSWIPQYNVPRNITMPACLPSSPIYSTFVMKKFGHLPIMYRFIPPPETCFTVKPMQGVIRKNHHVIVVEMFPKNHGKLLFERWAIRFNGNPDYERFVDFRGYADYPCLNFSNDAVKYSSTYPGCQRLERVLMLNSTRHEINYKFIDVPDELRIDRVEGTIYSNELLTHNWTFCPFNEGEYQFSVLCCYSSTSSTKSQNNEITYMELFVEGKCEKGHLVATPEELNFDELSYNEPKKLVCEIMNLSNVEIPYQLNLQQRNWPYEEKKLEQRVQLDPAVGNLFPGGKEIILVTLVPMERGYHEISMRYSVRKSSQTEDLISTDESREICRLKYFCHMPTIQIGDLLHYRIGDKISKYVLWRLLNINELNRIINDLQAGETREVQMRAPPLVLQSDSLMINFFIKNPTLAMANWSLKQMKLCSCPKTSEKRSLTFNSTKYSCTHRKLCTFHPKSGTLEAHENAVIRMELRYQVLGENTIKWDLELGYDRHVHFLINFTCLSENEEMAFPLYGPKVQLKNIYIGDRDPMNQICWLYNPTNNDVCYSLNTTPFRKLNNHHRLEIFDCLNPCGIVEKFSCNPMLIKYQPRQLGTLEVRLPLSIGNKLMELTIKGECSNDPLTRITEVSTPRHDLFQISELPVHFNTDNVNVPSMPLHSRTTRMIMIHNRLEHELVAYEWTRYELAGILEIDLEPRKGRIQPGSLQTFRLTVKTGGKSCRINADVTCEFINQSKKRAYERSLMMQEDLSERMKDYFTITEEGIEFPKPKNVLLEKPKPFYKVLTVRCHVYSPQDEEIKTLSKERLKITPPMEITIGKPLMKCPISTDKLHISNFILEGMIWNILQSTNICSRPKSTLKYSQIALKPVERKRIQERSYVTPASRMIEGILENMIFMIVHKEFALDTIHLMHQSDARQAPYQKIWQQVPGQERRLDESPEMQ